LCPTHIRNLPPSQVHAMHICYLDNCVCLHCATMCSHYHWLMSPNCRASRPWPPLVSPSAQPESWHLQTQPHKQSRAAALSLVSLEPAGYSLTDSSGGTQDDAVSLSRPGALLLLLHLLETFFARQLQAPVVFYIEALTTPTHRII
jgi:hypothetical protein